MNVIDVLPDLVAGIRYTVQITVVSFVIGMILAVPVTALRRSRWKALRLIGACYVELMRAVPPLPWLFLVFFGLPLYGIVLEPVRAGILVFGFVAAAYLSEVYRAGFRAVPSGQSEAACALGLSGRVAYVRVLVPQAVRTMLPLAITYLIGLLKDSAVVSIIGVQDISALAVTANRTTSDGLSAFIAAAILYLALSLPIAIAGRRLGGRLQRNLTTASV